MVQAAATSGRPRSARANVGVVSVGGSDAGAFLQGQLTCNVASLAPGSSRLCGWCDARGRLRAVARLLRRGDDEYWLLVPDESAERLRSRLSVYVLRSDAQIAVEQRFGAAALLGPAAGWLGVRGILIGDAADDACAAGGVGLVRAGPGLIYALGPAADVESLVGDTEPATADDVALAEIALGLPRLTETLEGRFIPQMLNLDLLGALAFDKGCYPGQEVVARTRNLGTVKRRMRRFAAGLGAAPEPDTEIRDDRGDPAGHVIRAARAGEGIELLAVVMVDAPASNLRVASHPDRPLTELALPY